MADKKITDLTELTAVANDDWLEIVDTSTGLSKKIQRSNLVGGRWVGWTPAVSAQIGSLTSYTASGRYCKIGKVVTCYLYIRITDNGTGSVAIVTDLPVPMIYGAIGTGRENAITGDQLQLYATGTTIKIFNYKNAYPAATGAVLIGSVTYEAA